MSAAVGMPEGGMAQLASGRKHMTARANARERMSLTQSRIAFTFIRPGRQYPPFNEFARRLSAVPVRDGSPQNSFSFDSTACTTALASRSKREPVLEIG
jgi:hypothetical protein